MSRELAEPPVLDQVLTRESPIIATFKRMADLEARGIDVIPFHLGEADRPTPRAALVAAQQALEAGETGYTSPMGRQDLREVGAQFFGAKHGVPLHPDNIAVCPGAKYAFGVTMQALVGRGDEVILPTPCWANHVSLIEVTGARSLLVEGRPDSGFLPSPDELRRAVSPRTRAILLTTPNNPAGTVCPAEYLEEVVGIARERGLTLVSDVMYREFCYTAPFASPAPIALRSDVPVVLIEGVSKAYAMPGFRIGFVIGPRRFLKRVASILGNTVTCAPNPSQVAARAALASCDDYVAGLRQELGERRERIIARIDQTRGFELPVRPQGGFFVFPDVRALLGKRTPAGDTIDNDIQLVDYLISRCHVGAVPGSAFSMPGFVRLAYSAVPTPQIDAGFDRIESAIGELAP